MNPFVINSVNDIRVVNGRYALIPSAQGIRVVSLVRKPYAELQSRIDSANQLNYYFARSVNSYREHFSQSSLARLMSSSSSRPATPQQRADLLASGIFRERHEAVEVPLSSAGIGKSELAGIPSNNTQLDPQKGGWIIATVTPTGLLFGSKPKVHTNAGAAEAELQRLATVSPGTEFVLLKAVKTAVTQTVQTKVFA